MQYGIEDVMHHQVRVQRHGCIAIVTLHDYS